ncbi:MAG: hypothetical protein ACXWZU_01770 [Actinomycetota bacterium]
MSMPQVPPPPIIGPQGRALGRKDVDRVGQEAPPPDDAWRYATEGAPRLVARLGVVLGFLMLVVPGLIALRSYRRWRHGAILQPSAAWVVAVLGIWIAILVPLAMYTDFVGLTIALTVVGPLASVAYVLRG